jgi:C1A family cysteine protease
MSMNTGYALELEEKEEVMCSAAEDLVGASDIPDRIDADWIRIEQQGRLSSCVGHGLTSAAESVIRANYGQTDQLSRMFAYLVSQRESGITGDRGATIMGAVSAAKTIGFLLETEYPYHPASYRDSPPITAVMRRNASHRVMSNHYRVQEDPMDACVHIAKNRGILLGIPWKESFAQERDERITHISGRVRGGHAICAISYQIENGEPWVQITNSHGSQWAKAGQSYVSPNVWSWMVRNGTVVALEGMSGYEPPVVDNLDWVFEGL